ncbi:hypothetical protein PR048_011387 [Dryococelus australis]|uniref:Uncharacterized protein n=1 Tax=Dryococelus australis TaxID=614101 RepID=A0ABQ9HLG0_9NEOP|nr:hypothetical protein PR048_011387 [Dryococelus australis]
MLKLSGRNGRRISLILYFRKRTLLDLMDFFIHKISSRGDHCKKHAWFGVSFKVIIPNFFGKEKVFECRRRETTKKKSKIEQHLRELCSATSHSVCAVWKCFIDKELSVMAFGSRQTKLRIAGSYLKVLWIRVPVVQRHMPPTPATEPGPYGPMATAATGYQVWLLRPTPPWCGEPCSRLSPILWPVDCIAHLAGQSVVVSAIGEQFCRGAARLQVVWSVQIPGLLGLQIWVILQLLHQDGEAGVCEGGAKPPSSSSTWTVTWASSGGLPPDSPLVSDTRSVLLPTGELPARGGVVSPAPTVSPGSSAAAASPGRLGVLVICGPKPWNGNSAASLLGVGVLNPQKGLW